MIGIKIVVPVFVHYVRPDLTEGAPKRIFDKDTVMLDFCGKL